MKFFIDKKQLTKIVLLSVFSLGILNTKLLAQNDTAKNAIVFNVIDNQALIYVNDELIFDSGVMAKFDLQLDVDLNKYLSKKNNVVKIVLNNELCDDCMSNPWSISYEIYENGEMVDYIYESGEIGKGLGGEVYSESLDWGNLF